MATHDSCRFGQYVRVPDSAKESALMNSKSEQTYSILSFPPVTIKLGRLQTSKATAPFPIDAKRVERLSISPITRERSLSGEQEIHELNSELNMIRKTQSACAFLRIMCNPLRFRRAFVTFIGVKISIGDNSDSVSDQNRFGMYRMLT